MTWMELEGIILREISRSEQDKDHMISLICGIEETKQSILGEERRKQNKTKSERETNRKRLLTLGNKLRAAGGEVGRRMA